MIQTEAIEAALRAWDCEIAEQSGPDAMRLALEAASRHIAADALDAAALDFEISPHNTKAKMARHFNNAYVEKLRARADSLRRGQSSHE